MRLAPLNLLRLTLLAAITGGCPPAEKPEVEPTCVDGTSILLEDGSPSGFERCADGAINRVEAGTFDPTIDLARCAGDEDSRTCAADGECADGAHGACVTGEAGGSYGEEVYSYCACLYSCASDADCATGEACVPPEVSGAAYATCVAATCADAGDCAATEECGYSAYFNGCGAILALDCRTEEDACHSDNECTEAEGACWSGYDGVAWSCGYGDCDIGRPLLVAGEARVAPPAPRADWLAPSDVSVPLDAGTRAAAAAYWARVAAFEHASVGSFARVTLQLLALGAPPELLFATQAAATDELRHAQLAYGLASRFGGAPTGPGPLPLADAAPALDARGVLLALINEACIGETLGAAELYAAADACIDTSLAARLRAVADDEAKHAALAWRTVRWILADVAPELRDEAVAALRDVADRAAAAASDDAATAPHLPAWGVFGGAARAAAHRATLAAVIAPCIDACVAHARAA